ncbi:MAG: ribonuclease R [Patiriisocius sp.]|jgi:ribonuclease R
MAFTLRQCYYAPYIYMTEINENNNIFEGTIAIRGKGIGFFIRPDQAEDQEDLLIETANLGFALDGDTVKVEEFPKVGGKRQEAKVLEVLESVHKEFVGTVKPAGAGKAVRYIQPDNHRIHVRPILPESTELDEGMKVVAEIASWTSPHTDPVGKIIETLGKAGDHETEMQAIIRSGGFSENFPEEISKAGQALYERQDEIFATAIENTKGENPTRRDMRDTTTMTIDPADAKDFDDALSYKKLENGNYEIGIHIADVSHYVEESGIIDIEAQKRATSIYLVDRVIPMLPEVLSNDLCSLRPEEDRLAFSAVFEMNPNAEVVGEWYGQTIIHSNRRFSYQEAQEVIDTQSGDNLDALNVMMTLGRMLRKDRYKNGAIAFEQPEVKFVLDDAGVPIDVVAKIRIETMMMIEDFMLLANMKVSEQVEKICKKAGNDTAFIYRIHDAPDPDRIEALAIFVHALGYEFKVTDGTVDAKTINKLLKDVEGSPEEDLLKVATIRSMAKAIYSTKNIGHFGLAFKHYSHFTSPIRRYPDLLAHRMLRKHLDGTFIGPKEMMKIEKTATHSSDREGFAVRAERNSIKYKQVEFMLDKVGEEFDGIITGVTDWGIYVQEKKSMADGMVRLGSIKGDYFKHEADKYRIKGDKTGSTYTLGQAVRVKLMRADLEERQLDFSLVLSNKRISSSDREK